MKVRHKWQSTEGILTGRNLLNRAEREKVGQVILVSEEIGLSGPVIAAGDLIPIFFRNFPNADFIVYSPIAGLFRPPVGHRLVVPKKSFAEDIDSWPYGRPDETLLFPLASRSMVTDDDMKRIGALSVWFSDFGLDSTIAVNVRSLGRLNYSLKTHSRNYQKRQQELLKYLGFDDLSDYRNLRLTPEWFSEELNRTVRRLERCIRKEAGDRPLLYVNILKGMEGRVERRAFHALHAVVQKAVCEFDVAVVFNEGPLEWKTRKNGAAHERVMRLYDSFGATAGRKAVLVRVGSNDIMRNAALLSIAKKSGGLLFDIQTGTSHYLKPDEVLLTMFSERITLDRETFKVLAADTRIEILKRLQEHKETLSDIAEAFKMSPSTIKEHLDRLSAAGLIAQEEGDTKWKYYKLTDKGKSIIKPYETRVWIMLAVSLMFLGASVYNLVGVVPEPAFAQSASAPETGLLKATDYGGVRETLPATEVPIYPAQNKTKMYAYLSLTLFFAVASGVMAARAMRV